MEVAMTENMHTDVLLTPDEIDIQVVGVGRRLVAMALDAVFVAFLSMIGAALAGMAGLVLSSLNSSDAEAVSNRFIIAFGLTISVIYFIGSWATGGQTLGNYAASIRVVSSDGSRISWGKATLRFIGYIVSAIPLSIGFLWIAFDSHRQGWHDKIARTYVIPSDQQFAPGEAVRFIPTDPERSWIWIAIWGVLAFVAPGVLIAASVWVLGPFMNHLIRYLAGVT